jgi:UDP-3-O-[3-hydroxymyristoyl] glucosamine N-acyltransferase
MIQKKYPELWERAQTITKTCPIDNTEDGCLTFAKSRGHLESLSKVNHRVHVITPAWNSINMPSNIIVHKVDNVKAVFIELHNMINQDNKPKPDEIHPTSIVHPTAVIGVPGNNIMKTPEGRIINMKHMGNVVLEEYTEVQALSVIHRSVFNSTIIRKNAQIFAKVNIGHNCDIGESTIVCPGTMLAGGTKVGKNCYIWQGVVTRSNVSICDNVIVGAGSLVLKDIQKPGVYFGSPAKYVKPYSEELR